MNQLRKPALKTLAILITKLDRELLIVAAVY